MYDATLRTPDIALGIEIVEGLNRGVVPRLRGQFLRTPKNRSLQVQIFFNHVLLVWPYQEAPLMTVQLIIIDMKHIRLISFQVAGRVQVASTINYMIWI
jgi:hypothetical protein